MGIVFKNRFNRFLSDHKHRRALESFRQAVSLTVIITRVNSTFAATAKSFAFKTANPSPSSYSAKTLAASHGPFSFADSTRRVSLRYVLFPRMASSEGNWPLTIQQEVAKKRTRRTVKSQRGIVGASLDVIKERRSQRPEARAAARQAAVKKGKEEKREAESKKKQEKAKTAAKSAAGQTRGQVVGKQQAKGAGGGGKGGKGR